MRRLLIAAAAAGVLLAAPAFAQTSEATSPLTQAAQTQTSPAAQDFSARRHWRHWGWRHRHWGWRHRHHWGWRHRHWHRW